jgi:hypothetical protein
VTSRKVRSGQAGFRQNSFQQTRARIGATISALKPILFSVSTEPERESWDRFGRLQQSKYGHLGLRHVPVSQMPAAIDEVFSRLRLKPKQRLVEIGPGPHGGVGLVAALMGLHVAMVEYDQPFVVNIDLLKQQLKESPDSETRLAPIAHMNGTIRVDPIENLEKLLSPFHPLVTAAGGSIQIVAGDIASAGTRGRVGSLGQIDHVVCTDVISPMNDTLDTTTAATTTGDRQRVEAILEALAFLAGEAQTLYISVIVPEQSDGLRERIAEMYQGLEQALIGRGRSLYCERAISPSSGTVLRSRLYHLAGPPVAPPVYMEPIQLG